MPLLLTGIIVALQACWFLFESTVSVALFSWWWIPQVAAFALVGWLVSKSTAVSVTVKLIAIFCLGVAVLLIQWVFYDTMTLFLSGALILGFLVIAKHWIANDITAIRCFQLTVALISVSLVVLPVSINRITVKLPSLSADTRLELQAGVEAKPVQSGRHYQHVDSPGELKIYLSTQIYFQQPHDPPVLKVSIERERIVVVLQDIYYEYAVGFLKLSLRKIFGADLQSIKPAQGSDDFQMVIPPTGGLKLEQFKVGDSILLQLPNMADHKLSWKDRLIVPVGRLAFWLFAAFLIWHWRPQRPHGGRQ
ncbi:MAG: hypothetical protein AAF402_08485 [Pseudomonadota bacterium]